MIIITHRDVKKFIYTLEPHTIAKVLRNINLLERFGYALGMPHSKPIGDGLYELRIRGQQEVRVLYTFHRQRIILLHGFLKKSDRIPKNELAVAIDTKNRLQ